MAIQLKNQCRVYVKKKRKYAFISFSFLGSPYSVKPDAVVEDKFHQLFDEVIAKIPESDKTTRKNCYDSRPTHRGHFHIPKEHVSWFLPKLVELLTDPDNITRNG